VYSELPEDRSQPFIIKGLKANAAFRAEVSLDNLYNTHGERSVGIDHDISYGKVTDDWEHTTMADFLDRYVHPYHNMSMGEIYELDEKQKMIFGPSDTYVTGKGYSMISRETQDMFKCIEETKEKGYGICPKGTGVGFHVHHNALNELVYGKKMWFFYESLEKVPRLVNRKTTMKDVYKIFNRTKSKVKKCIQEEGDIINVPYHWAHATFNLETSFAVVCVYQNDTDASWYMRGSTTVFPFWYKHLPDIRFKLAKQIDVEIRDIVDPNKHRDFFEELLLMHGNFSITTTPEYNMVLKISVCQSTYLSFINEYCAKVFYVIVPDLKNEPRYLFIRFMKDQYEKKEDQIFKVDAQKDKSHIGFF
jgi:hypothetical protein